jgi:hypothetical protein
LGVEDFLADEDMPVGVDIGNRPDGEGEGGNTDGDERQMR